MIKEGEYNGNQTKMSFYSAELRLADKSPQLEEPPTFREGSLYKMASSQPMHSGNQGNQVQQASHSPESSENQTPMITLTLLHPQQAVAVQTWRFEPKSVIRIGRSRDNEVTLYSAVVSRHHVEIRQKGSSWEVVNTGSNGTFCDGKRINRTPVQNGMVVRLASSGPQIQIWTDVITSETEKSKGKDSSSRKAAEKAKSTFLGTETRSKLSKEELDRAKETQID